jgi:hypothetical protein
MHISTDSANLLTPILMYILPLGKMYFKAGAIDFLFLGPPTQKQKGINQIHFLASSQKQLYIITPSVEDNYLNDFFPHFYTASDQQGLDSNPRPRGSLVEC